MDNKSKTERSQWYLLYSTATGKPYIDPHGSVHAYKSEELARQANIPDTMHKLITTTAYELFTLCYEAGAATLTWHTYSVTKTDALREQDLPIRYFNHTLCSTLAKIKQFHKKQDMYFLGGCEFLVPVRILHEQAQIQVIYGTAQRSEDDKEWLYLAFSTLSEYEVWRSAAAPDAAWRPLKLRFSSLREVCGSHGVLLNPAGDRLVIPPAWIRAITEKQEAERKEEEKPKEAKEKPEDKEKKA